MSSLMRESSAGTRPLSTTISRILLRSFCGAGWCLAGPAAVASSWNQPAGAGLLIADYTAAGGARYFNGAGRLSPAAAYNKIDGFAYIEYGITDRLMAIIKPDVVSVSLGRPGTAMPAARYVGIGTSDVGAQLQIATYGPAVLAGQAAFRLPGTVSQSNPALIGGTSRDLDLRALGGLSLEILGVPTFLDVQAAYRIRSSGAPAEGHADVTLGARPQPRLLLLVQSETSIPVGRGTAWFPASFSTKLSCSLVYDVTARWSVQVGVFQTLAGIDALRERGYRTALWYRF